MRATWVLVLLNVLVYVVMLFSDGVGHVMGFTGTTLIGFGADYAPLVLRDGEWWRLFCASLVHVNLLHIGLNMNALFQVGRVLEQRWGAPRILVAYFVTGVLGSLASVLWNADHPTVAAGASGAICGLAGATIVVAHLMGGPAHRVRNSMAVWIATVIGYGFLMRGIDNAAHLGGLVAGAVTAFVVEKLGVRRRGGVVADVLAIGGFLLVALAAFALALTHSATRVGID